MNNFMAAFTPNAVVLQDDMPNYTDIEPIIQISEVVAIEYTNVHTITV